MAENECKAADERVDPFLRGLKEEERSEGANDDFFLQTSFPESDIQGAENCAETAERSAEADDDRKPVELVSNCCEQQFAARCSRDQQQQCPQQVQPSSTDQPSLMMGEPIVVAGQHFPVAFGTYDHPVAVQIQASCSFSFF